MDRTMYGKIDPGARQPYRCTLKQKGISPAYALLADLQNSVPGYGSIRTPQSPTYQHQQRVVTETRSSPSPAYSNSNQYYNQGSGSLPRSQNSLPRSQTPQQSNAANFSELDSLLEDLSKGRYNNSSLEKKDLTSTPYNGKVSPSPYSNTSYNDSLQRPTVDSLLDELSNANNSSPLYAVPNGTPPTGKAPTPGRHVTITVRETKTEKITGPDGDSVAKIDEQVLQQKDQYQLNSSQQSYYPASASSATKELDDLMASLSDFKINSGSHHHQTVTDYAKPNKGVSHTSTQQVLTQTSTLIHEQADKPPTDQLDSMLGNLQADMNRQGVTTTQKGCCNACDKPIVGQVITALGKTWHPEHFTCNHCNQELGTRNFFERDGYPYCEPDYHNLFSPRCAYCNGAILDKCVTALDKTWHTEHFFCAQCGQQFGEEGFHERDGKPYCRNDYFDMFAPKCNGCNRPIMENYISALNAQWHADCFVCRDCKKPVRGKSFYAMEGKPVCPPCVGIEEEEE
ncbi:transforming growth factor beta-1-induced transcript 1 protein [Hermetia illucens]|uniref:transforming growth factor beta-1-induced transcript 1 protein n=1 Tax=Hermetia illucens TaxID=343691 RepID=UPI0018CBF385|nr:transforming growth factor beta-1-induced transcript 1 protein [Hermetia illucens]